MRSISPDSEPGSASIERIIFRVILRGEFKLRSAIVLMSVYGAAILVIPVILNSAFSVSISYLGLEGNFAQQQLVLSIYSEASRTFGFVESLLFVGLVITCLLSGLSIGRRARSSESLLSHLGVSRGKIKNLMMLALFSLTILCVALGFSLAIILSSMALFSMSLLFGVPATAISIGENMLVYLLALLGIGYLALVLGWSRTFRNIPR